MIDKAKAIELLERQIASGRQGQSGRDPAIRTWLFDTIAVLERVFGAGSRQVETFNDIRWSPRVHFINCDNSEAYEEAYRAGFAKSLTVLESALKEVKEFWEIDHPAGTHSDPFHRIEQICERFHSIQRKLRARHASRPTLEVSDEYDVQDLIHALLLLDFDDVRAEEWTPSYAGASSRMDFLMKREKIVLEVKRTRDGLKAKEVGEQLIVDCQRYKAHRDCQALVCFVYDPEGFVSNPRGVENDLSTAGGDLLVKVFIRPIN